MAQSVVSPEISSLETARLERLMSMLPKSAGTILEIGARHGVMTRKLSEICNNVTALDLRRPPFDMEHVTTVAGDVQRLQFPDNSFDCVVCTEVLEHVPDFAAGAREIQRVAKSRILIGVPYRQDTREGRTTCVHCGKINPPFGHLNTFDERKLKGLFSQVEVASVEYLSNTRDRTNFLSTWLQDLGKNPFGTYDQEEPCIACGRKLQEPTGRSLVARMAAALGHRLYNLQRRFNRPRPTWILMLFEKRRP